MRRWENWLNFFLVHVHKHKNESVLLLWNEEENIFFSKEVSIIIDFKKSTVAFNDPCSNTMLEPIKDVFQIWNWFDADSGMKAAEQWVPFWRCFLFRVYTSLKLGMYKTST